MPTLRARVLDTSRELLATGGLPALSMREVARRAGVTHQAPYHYFPDKESILAELVTEGFEELARRMCGANDAATQGGKLEVLRRAAEAYLGFALEHPAVFRVMFRPELCDAGRFPRALAAAEGARAECERLVRIVHDGHYSQALASMHWAHVHGLACLVLDGPLGVELPTEEARRAHLMEASAHFAVLVVGGSLPPWSPSACDAPTPAPSP
jgi:AcrR family transcriptional regulator